MGMIDMNGLIWYVHFGQDFKNLKKGDREKKYKDEF
jgi:hypothetical protein